MNASRRAPAAGVLGLAVASVVPATVATQKSQRPRPRPSRLLLVNVHDLGEAGLAVLAVSWFSPTRNMVRAGNPWLRGSLERGDIITHINGRRLQGAGALQDELNRSRGAVTLTVLDGRSAASVTWRVTPARVVAPGEPLVPIGPVALRGAGSLACS
jgi:hypothetical protein